jgi:hypothetical protein
MQGVIDAVGGIAQATIEHCSELDDDALLVQLAELEASVEMLKGARLHLLRHARHRDIPWNKIGSHTGVHPSTWRFRFEAGMVR